MHCKTKLNLKIVLVPSYIDAVLRTNPSINYESVLKLGDLKSILIEKDILIFLLMQDRIDLLTEKVFCDIPHVDYMSQDTINPSDKILWENKKNALYEQLVIKSKLDGFERNEKDEDGPLIKECDDVLGKEYYVPRMLDSGTLMLIGSTIPQYKNSRAFFNATIECLSAGGVRYIDYKHLEVFRNYLKHAIDD